MGMFDDLFGGGGGSDGGSEAQIEMNEDMIKFIEQQAAIARGDALNLYPQSLDIQNQGYNAAHDILQQSIPEQMAATRGGNIRAQETLLEGMPQQNNAILGMPVDTSGFKVSNQGASAADIFRDSEMPNYTEGNTYGLTPEEIDAIMASLQAGDTGQAFGNGGGNNTNQV